MKAARFFSICEIVCFVGLALSYAGEFLCAFVAQGTDKDIFQMGLFLFWLLIGPLAICNLICAAVMYRRLSDPAVRRTRGAEAALAVRYAVCALDGRE